MFGNKKKQEHEIGNVLRLLERLEQLERRPPQIVIAQESEYRPCWVRGKKAIFHRWANSARPVLPRGVQPSENERFYQFRNTLALVEYEDGTMERVYPSDIQFADHGRFRDYCWLPAVEHESEEEQDGGN